MNTVSRDVLVPWGAIGRSITYAAKFLVEFYERHRVDLVAELDPVAVAALDALAAALPLIMALNPPGPE